MSILVHGIKIYLASEFTQDTDIGLYTAAGVSTFRWSEAALTGASETYKVGMLAPGGIPAIDEGGIFNRGGDYITVKGITITICNTARFWKALDDAGIGINGLRAEIIEFEIAAATGAVSTETTRGWFKTSIDTWNVGSYQIPLEPAVYNRNAPMGTQVDIQAFPNASDDDIGKMIPCTFGKFYSDRYAKIVRTVSKQTKYNTKQFAEYVQGSSISFPIGSDVTMFPVVYKPEYSLAYGTLTDTFLAGEQIVGATASDWAYVIYDNGSDTMQIYFANGNFQNGDTITGQTSGATAVLTDDATDISGQPTRYYVAQISASLAPISISGSQTPTDIYLYVAEDTNSLSGKYVKISYIKYSHSYRYIFYIDEFLEANLTPESSGAGSWVSFVQIAREYQLDVFKCGGFIDKEGNAVSTAPYVFSYDDNSKVKVSALDTYAPVEKSPYSFIRLPDYGYQIATGTDYNKIVIAPYFFESSIDQISAYTIIPAKKIELVDAPDLADYGLSNYVKVFNGVYRLSATSNPSSRFISSTLDNPFSNAIDKDSTTYAQHTLVLLRFSGVEYIIMMEFDAPDIDENMPFDSVYLGIKFGDMVEYDTANSFYVRLNQARFMGAYNAILSTTYADKYYPGKGSQITGLQNLPDEYFTDAPNTNNEYFKYNNDLSGSSLIRIYGLTRYELTGVTDYEKYHAISRCTFYLHRNLQRTEDKDGPIDRIRLYELAFVFKKSMPIKDAIYTYCNGRIFNDTWGSRKTAANLIEDPIDQYEHACRLQNWSDAGDTSIEYGKAYSASAIINTATTLGGFDSLTLADVRDRRFSFQITDYDKSWTKSFKEEMLRATWCVGYIDEEGKECIAFLPRTSSTTPSDTVTLGSVPEGMRIGDVEEPRPENVFCEPFVRYNWNEGAQRFDGLIAIKQVHKSSWAAAYTPGFDGSEGEHFWQVCHDELWTRYHQIEVPPSDMTDQYFISTLADAKWFLTTWLDWMLVRRVSIPVYYDLAKAWHPGRHIYIQLHHQTNNTQREAVVERIVKNKNAGYCELHVAFWVEEPTDYYYKERMYDAAAGADADWKDTMDAGNPNYKNNM